MQKKKEKKKEKKQPKEEYFPLDFYLKAYIWIDKSVKMPQKLFQKLKI